MHQFLAMLEPKMLGVFTGALRGVLLRLAIAALVRPAGANARVQPHRTHARRVAQTRVSVVRPGNGDQPVRGRERKLTKGGSAPICVSLV
jgi:hypothetical protein